MSIILKKFIHILILSSSIYCFSQVHSEKKEIIVYFDIKDKAINSYFVKKDSSEATFSVFLKGFEQKKARNKAMKDYKNEIGDADSSSSTGSTNTGNNGGSGFNWTIYFYNVGQKISNVINTVGLVC
jgi:hypothetical protein